MPSILLFGGTGLIGSRLAIEIKKANPSWPLTVFLRSTSVDSWFHDTAKVDKLVHGDISDRPLVRSLSKEHDIVINAISSFDGEFISHVIAGMEENPVGHRGTLIHISGTGNFIDHGKTGSFNPQSKVWNDDNAEDMKLISKDMFNGPTDVPVLEAGVRGLTTYIVNFAMTYGVNIGPNPNKGVAYSLLTSNAKSLGFSPYVGDGTAVASVIHAADGVRFLSKIITLAGTTTAKANESPYERYYIVHGERVAWKDLAPALAKILYKKGAIKTAEAKSVGGEDGGAGEIGALIASNMLVKGDRAARMGFEVKEKSILECMEEDLAPYDI